MKKITEIILDKDAPLNLKSLWAEPQEDSTIALKVFNNGKWESATTNVDLSAYQTKTDESLQTSDKTIAGAINELNSNIGESGYNLIEYGVTTYDELVEMAGNGKPSFLVYTDGVIYSTTLGIIQNRVGITPQAISGTSVVLPNDVKLEAIAVLIPQFFVDTDSVYPDLSGTVNISISSTVQEDSSIFMYAPSGTAVKNYVTEQLEPYAKISDVSSTYQPILVSGTNIKTVNGESLLGEGDITIETGPSEITWDSITGKPSFATVATSGSYSDLTGTPDLEKYATKEALGNKVDKIEGKQLSTEDYTTEDKEKLASLENYDDSSLRNELQQTETGVATANSEIEKLKSGKQDIIIPGTGLAFDSNTLNVTLDTNVFFVAESAPASPTDDQKKKICLVPADTTEEGNFYTEYVWVVDDEHSAGYWEEFGTYKSEVDLTPYLKKEDAAATYLTKENAESTYLSKTEGTSTYLSQTNAAATYQPKGDYVTTTALTEGLAGKQDTVSFNTAYNASTNKAATMQDITSAVADKVEQSDITSAIQALDSEGQTCSNGEVISSVTQTDGVISVQKKTLAADDIPELPQSKITDLETTLAGKQDAGDYATKTELAGKQDAGNYVEDVKNSYPASSAYVRSRGADAENGWVPLSANNGLSISPLQDGSTAFGTGYQFSINPSQVEDQSLATTSKNLTDAVNELKTAVDSKQDSGDYALKNQLPSYTTVPELTADYTIPANATTREFVYQIPVGGTPHNITGAEGIKWASGVAPTTQMNHTYIVSVINNLAVWGEF